MEDVQGVRLQDLAVMHEPAHLVGGGRDLIDADHGVHGLRRRKVMAHRADAAEPLNDDRNLPEHAAADEPFESAELDDVEARFSDFAGLVQPNSDLAVAFDASDRIDHDLASRACLNAVHNAAPQLRDRPPPPPLFVLEQLIWKLRLFAPEEGFQPLPDHVRRRRATGQEVVDLDEFMRRIDPVEQERQILVARDHPAILDRWSLEIDFLQAFAQPNQIPHSGDAAVYGTGADRYEDVAMLAKLLEHMDVVLIRAAAFHEPD